MYQIQTSSNPLGYIPFSPKPHRRTGREAARL